MNPFVKSREMMDLIQLAKHMNVRPCDLMDLEGTYERYCFDEAAMLYSNYLEQKKKPRFESDRKTNPTLRALVSGAL